jgi:hypothetical protein
MNFDAALTSSVQVFAALLMFIAGYLALIVGAIMCAMIAELFLKGSIAQAYAVRSSSLDNDSRCQASRTEVATR